MKTSIWSPRPHSYRSRKTTSTICRCALRTGSLRCWCMNKRPPPWAALPAPPSPSPAPDSGPRGPGLSDRSVTPETLPTNSTCAACDDGTDSCSRLTPEPRPPRPTDKQHPGPRALRLHTQHAGAMAPQPPPVGSPGPRSLRVVPREAEDHGGFGEYLSIPLPPFCFYYRERP